MNHNIPVSKPLSVAVFAVFGKTRFEKGFLKKSMHAYPGDSERKEGVGVFA